MLTIAQKVVKNALKTLFMFELQKVHEDMQLFAWELARYLAPSFFFNLANFCYNTYNIIRVSIKHVFD